MDRVDEAISNSISNLFWASKFFPLFRLFYWFSKNTFALRLWFYFRLYRVFPFGNYFIITENNLSINSQWEQNHFFSEASFNDRVSLIKESGLDVVHNRRV